MNNTFRKYLIEIGQYPLLSQTEETELAYAYRDGDMSAREKLILSNLRLVVSVAKNYKNTHLSIADLVSEGNLGLIQAVEKYNPDLGYRFSTCAVPWVKQAISKAITDKGRNIRIPAHMYQLLAKYRAALVELGADGQPFTDKDIAEKIGVETEKVAELRKLKHDTISMETKLNSDSKETIGDLIPDTYSETPDEYTEKQILHDKIMKVIATFKPRTQAIIKLRYGLGTETDPMEYHFEHTLEEIGEILGITRERVRQIEKQTLAEMKLIWDRVK